MVNKWLKIVQRSVQRCLQLPSYCLLCCRPSLREFALCVRCEEKLPWLPPVCLRCALPEGEHAHGCFCRRQAPPYERLQALFDYAWPVQQFIAKWKYGGQLEFAKLFAHFMVERLTPQYAIDRIIPVPLHAERLSERGFNQSIELANLIAKHYGFYLDRRSCTRVRNTLSQSQLSAKHRQGNISAQTFHICPDFKAKHVLIIEDIVTTGATISALCRALKKHGVQTVEIWCCCRTLINAKSLLGY